MQNYLYELRFAPENPIEHNEDCPFKDELWSWDGNSHFVCAPDFTTAVYMISDRVDTSRLIGMRRSAVGIPVGLAAEELPAETGTVAESPAKFL